MKKVLFLLLVGIFLFAETSSAYVCWKESDARKRARDADTVFIGEAVQIDDMEPDKNELGTPRQSIYFLVNKSWKGVSTEYVSVDTEELYEYKFELGKKYLVFAYKIYDKRLSMVGCPRVKLLSEAAKDIEELGEPKE